MAKVYTGKVSIPGDKIDEFLQIMKETEERREPFRQFMTHLNEEFHDSLVAKFSERTAQKHSFIVEMFIEFVCRHTDVERIEDITKGMVNTHFKQWWKRKVWDSTTPDQITASLKKFFLFLAQEKGIVNEKAMKGLL